MGEGGWAWWLNAIEQYFIYLSLRLSVPSILFQTKLLVNYFVFTKSSLQNDVRQISGVILFHRFHLMIAHLTQLKRKPQSTLCEY